MVQTRKADPKTTLYPEIEPGDHGMLQVDCGEIYWEICGNPEGKPALVLHGGPGSGCTPAHRRFFDPTMYRIVLFDQRNCGRSTPSASTSGTSLSHNTTNDLVADIEDLRRHLDVERWLVWGGSWGSTLAVAYAVAHPEKVSEMILWGVTTGRHCEFDWLFRGGAARFFPEQWAKLRSYVPGEVGDHDVPAAYNRLLMDPDPAIHHPAARQWCLWESATGQWPPTDQLAPRFSDPSYALAFARIVTTYVSHNGWLEDGELLERATILRGKRGILVNGRLDFQAPLGNAWALHRAWPGSELVVVDDAAHSPTGALVTQLVSAARQLV